MLDLLPKQKVWQRPSPLRSQYIPLSLNATHALCKAHNLDALHIYTLKQNHQQRYRRKPRKQPKQQKQLKQVNVYMPNICHYVYTDKIFGVKKWQNGEECRFSFETEKFFNDAMSHQIFEGVCINNSPSTPGYLMNSRAEYEQGAVARLNVAHGLWGVRSRFESLDIGGNRGGPIYPRFVNGGKGLCSCVSGIARIVSGPALSGQGVAFGSSWRKWNRSYIEEAFRPQ